jgi:hypothetical protein
MEFNFEGLTYYELCNFTEEHGRLLAEKLTSICEEMEENIDDYIFKGTGEYDDREGVHKGRVLARLLKEITDDKERLILYFTFDCIMDRLVQTATQKDVINALRDAMNAIFGKNRKQQETEN